MDGGRRTEPVGALGSAAAADPVTPDVPLRLVTERILLSALREQDAAIAAEAERDRAQFLADASLRFGASLDQELTYAAIAGVSLPGLDAWCVVDVVEVGGGLRRLAVIHPDEDKHAIARNLAGRWMPIADDMIGVPAVQQTREPVVIVKRASVAVAAAARDPETLRVLRELGAGALLVVPIVTHDTLLGAITFVSRPGAPIFTADDIRFAAQIAARCAQALEAARLYAAARAAWAEAEASRADADAARRTAEESNASKAKFLSTMSHELRTPLNAIGGYAQLLELGIRGPVTNDQKSDLVSIQRSQAHLLGLVDAVLNYAQLEAGYVVYATANIELGEVVAGVHAFVAPQMRSKGVGYSFLPCPSPLIVRAEAAKVRQIVLNLVGNATKFTPSGGHIAVSCAMGVADKHAPGDDMRVMHSVRVSDTGSGIPSDKLEAIFDPFVQVNRTLSSPDVGVGLGLAIGRELARGMGGDLVVASTQGVGTTFTLTLPAAD